MASADPGALGLRPAGELGRLYETLGPLVALTGPEVGREAVDAGSDRWVAIRVESGGQLRIFEASAGSGGSVGSDVAPRQEQEMAGSLRRFVREARVVAWDATRIRRSFVPSVVRDAAWLDLLELSCVLRPECPRHDSATLVRELLGRPGAREPRAAAMEILAVLEVLAAEVDGGGHDALLEVLRGLEESWAWAPLFARRLALDWGPLGRSRSLSETSDRGEQPPPEEGAATFQVEDVPALLAQEARFASVIPGYRLREGQIELTEAIATAFLEDRALAVEAGTGIGKTLSYGLVAFVHAMTTQEQVVVSSANRTLQERIISEELPAIARALGVAPIPALVLKGRANYGNPSLARSLAAGDGESGLRPFSRLYLQSYFSRCPKRDLQGFGSLLAERDASLRAVRQRIACSGDCDLRACRSEPEGACGYLSRVDALPGARVVSINHALLLSWPQRYGSIERLVVDEAHELVGEGDRAFGETVQSRELRASLQRAGTRPTRDVLEVLAVRVGRDDVMPRVLELVDRVGRGVDALGECLLAAVPDQEALVPEASLIPAKTPWSDASVAARALVEDLDRLADCIEEVAPGEPGDAEEAGVPPDAVQREGAALGRMFRAASRGVLADLFAQTRDDHVYAARAQRRRDGAHEWSVTVTPLDAAELIHARALESPKTVVALSATLGVGGDPTPTLDKLGWRALPRARRMESRVLPSPFDFSRHAVLGLVRGRTYRDEGFAEQCALACAATVRLLGGRTMALFTSRRRLYDVAELLRRDLAGEDFEILVQPPSGGAADLVERFTAHPRAVLLGTRSLWQGVDIPGDALSCVLVDKFPFPQPNDPLLLGRQARLRELGEDAFRALSLEPAVILFKQMFGRLIRSESDRGFVVVLGADPDRPYVGDFIASLPGPPRVLVDSMARILEEMEIFFEVRRDAASSRGRG